MGIIEIMIDILRCGGGDRAVGRGFMQSMVMTAPPQHELPPFHIENRAVGRSDARSGCENVYGQEHVKRAPVIAAAGNHNVRLVGPPGVGKSLLSRAVPGILPQLILEEALEVIRIYSVADLLLGNTPLIRHRPFQAPHHTISQAGLVGGGTIPKPGAISLSHRGVLFLMNTKNPYAVA